MAASLPEAVGDNAHDLDDVGEPVVTALGSGGRYYICVKTRPNEYKQHSKGLPTALEAWLFPADGSTRDLDTLQVILTGEDGFWAADKNGELRSDDAQGPSQGFQRRMTWHGQKSAGPREHQPDSSRPGARDTALRRPSTIPHPSAAVPEPPGSHMRSVSADKHHGRPRMPVVARPQKLAPAPAPADRRRTLAAQEERGGPDGPRKEAAPRPASGIPKALIRRWQRAGYGAGEGPQGNPRAPPPAASPPRAEAVPQAKATPTACYADTGVQTEPPPEPPPEHCPSCCCLERRSSSNGSLGLTMREQHSAFDSLVSEAGFGLPETQALNPVAMGKMQDYFRSTSYTLGDALGSCGMG